MRVDVARRWRRLAKKALADGCWDGVLTGEDMVDVMRTDERLVLDRVYEVRTGHEFLFFPVMPELSTVCKGGLPDVEGVSNRNEWYARLRQLTLAGIDRFWFCAGVLACKEMPLFPRRIATPDEEKALALTLLEKIALWFPVLCSLQGRFEAHIYSQKGWLQWGMVAWGLCREAGMDEQMFFQIRDFPPAEATKAISEWVATRKAALE